MRNPATNLAAVLLVSAVLAACGANDSPDSADFPSKTPPPPGSPGVTSIVASGLAVPWGIAFLPDGSAIVTERDSRRVLRLIPPGDGNGGEAEITEIGEFEEAAPTVEAGLLGVAVSPDFARDAQVFFYATTAEDNTVFKATLEGDELGDPTPILTGIPNGEIHNGGRLAFGPDGFLYVSTGETGDSTLAQDPSSLAGKILRITPEGEPAPGNPFTDDAQSDPRVFSLGHRNVQGLAFDDAGRLWASEFGAETFDELNQVTGGANYGWPEVEGRGGEPDYVDPVLTWNPEDASPSGLAFAEGTLWMAALRGQRLWEIPLEDRQAKEPIGLLTGEYGRIRTVVTTPEGDLWVATSNRDGRGSPAADDDRILLLSLED